MTSLFDPAAPRGEAHFSDCGTYRYELSRQFQEHGPLAAFFGINPSTADALNDDQTTKKIAGFCRAHSFRGYLLGNVFAYCATNVADLATAPHVARLENLEALRSIISRADVLIPCWGNTSKVPARLRHWFGKVLRQLLRSGKPVLTLGLTKGGDPRHPLRLPYSTPLEPYLGATS